jgi:hypothetical protein
MTYKLRILSLGAGVQSSTLLLMAEKGIIEPFDCAIFADTGWESHATYQWLEWLKQTCKTPIITATGKYGNIYDHTINAPQRRQNGNGGRNCGVALPIYLTLNGVGGMGMRQCTDKWKIQPIKQEARRLLGLVPRQRAPKDCVEQVVGISLDEARRMKPSRDRMSFLSYPLVHMGMTRLDCMNWLTRNGYPIPPKSSCVGCPFHSNNEWREVMKSPVEWQQAVNLDNRIRSIEGFRGNLFLHRSCKPLEEVDLSTPEERGQGVFDFIKDEKLNMFVNKLSI